MEGVTESLAQFLLWREWSKPLFRTLTHKEQRERKKDLKDKKVERYNPRKR